MISRRGLLKALSASPLAGWLRAWAPGASAFADAPDALARYRPAFGRLARLTEAERTLVDGWKIAPLDGTVDALLDRLAPTLDDLARGAAMARCDWVEVTREGDLIAGDRDVFNPRLAKLALLRARRRAADGDARGTLDDAFAAASFGRHLGRAGLLMSRAYQFSVENQAVAALASILPGLAESALASLPGRVARLPMACSWTETMRLEGRYIASTVAAKVRAGRDPLGVDDVRDLLFADEAEARAILEATGGARSRVLALVRDLVPYLAGLAEVMELPHGRFGSELAAFRDRPGGVHPIAGSVVDMADQIRFASDRTALLWTMLLAARVRVVEGLGRFRDVPDPYGDGPFAVEEVPGGFELRSAFHPGREPAAVVRVGGPIR